MFKLSVDIFDENNLKFKIGIKSMQDREFLLFWNKKLIISSIVKSPEITDF